MKKCKQCSDVIPRRAMIDGKLRVLNTRKFCLKCSPFGTHNTRDLTADLGDKKKRDAAKYRKWQQKARLERKLNLVAMLGGKCSICEYDKCLRCLHFHHRDPSTKSFTMATFGLCRRWETLVEEAKKCDLLCPTCHCELHEVKSL